MRGFFVQRSAYLGAQPFEMVPNSFLCNVKFFGN